MEMGWDVGGGGAGMKRGVASVRRLSRGRGGMWRGQGTASGFGGVDEVGWIRCTGAVFPVVETVSIIGGTGGGSLADG